jgi:autotransporter-associated beta strand protein
MKFIKNLLKEKSGSINSNLSAPATDNDFLYQPRRTMMALEPRIMFDGAAVETAADTTAAVEPAPPLQDAAAIEAAKLAEAAADVAPPAVQADPAQQQRTEVLFVENNVADYQTLINNAKPGSEVHVLDASQDGLAQMAQILDGRSGIDAIHVISHGAEGTLSLGSVSITSANTVDYMAQLTEIGQTLSADGDILLYGCNTGRGGAGISLMMRLSELTGADIAASTDDTGTAALGGDWILETQVGQVEASVMAPSADANYQGLLAVSFSQLTLGSNPFNGITISTAGDYIVGDFNTDGAIDMRIYNGSAEVTYLNNGTGTFASVSGAGDPLNGIAMSFNSHGNTTVADFDADGDVDIVWYNTGTTAFRYFQNTNGHSYTELTLGSNPFNGITISTAGDYIVGDFNTDGAIDMRIYNGSAEVTYLNNGTGTFASVSGAGDPLNGIAMSFNSHSNTTVADFDADGDVDIVWYNTGTTAFRYFQNTNGHSYTELTLGSNPFNGITISTVGDYIVGDFNTDGAIDMRIWNGSAEVTYLNNGTGTFASVSGAGDPLNGIATSFNSHSNTTVADFDADGDVDIAWYNSGFQYVRENNSPPKISSSTPADNGTGFTPNANIVLTFNETISSAGTGAIKIYRSSDHALIESIPGNDARVTGTGSATITINPTTTLADSTNYYVLIDKRAFYDADGMTFQGISLATVLNFTTGVLNVAPSLGGTFTTAGTVNDNATTTPFSGVTYTDPDGGTYSVSITYTAANGTLAGTGLTGSAGSYTVTGSSAADVQAKLQALVFTPTANQVAPSSTVETTFTLTPNDSIVNGTANATTKVTATSINNAPTLGGAAAGQAVNDNATVSPFSAFTVADPDSGASVTASIALDTAAKGAFTAASLTASGFSTADGGLTYTRTAATPSAMQTAIRALVYQPAANRVAPASTETTTFTVSINDGIATAVTNNATTVVSTSINDAPVNTKPATQTTNEDTALVFSAGNGNALSVTDADVNTTLTTVISVAAGTGTVAVTTGGGATITGDGSNSVQIVGTVAQVQAALASVTYTPTTNANGAGYATLTISSTDDGAGTLNDTDTVTINVTAINDVPSFTKGADQTINEDAGAQTVNGWATGLSQGPANESSQTLSFNVTNDNNGLFSAQPAIDSSGKLTYTAAANANGTATVTVSIQDNGGGTNTSATQTFTITVNAVNDAPVLTAGASLNYTENGSAAVIDNTITLVDVDDTQIAGATVTISSGFTSGDALGFTNQNGITGSYNSGTGVLTLSGTATKANYQTALRSVTYSSSSDTPTSGSASRTVTWAVTDAAATGSIGAQTSTGVTSTVNLTAVNDAPVLTAGASLNYTENGSAAVIDNTITLVDVDDTQIAGATVTISSGFTSGDALGFTNQNGITGSYNSGTGVLTLSGTATKANYQTALRSVTYSSSSDTPTSGSASRTVTWAVTDANASAVGAQTSTGVTSTINVTAVNDAPTAIALSSTTSSTYDSGSNVTIGSLTRTDVDGGGPTYSIVSVNTNTSGATYDLFNISGATLRAANPSTTTAGDYTVVIRVNDGTSDYDQSFTITVSNALIVTTNLDSGDDATTGSTYAAELADGGGLSLREALSFATSGSTIQFAAGLSGQTITLGSNVTVADGVILDVDSMGAPGTLTITGNTLNISGALTINNGSGDALTIASTLAGSGTLTKTGAGTLTLSSTSNSSGFSGGITVSAGTLSVFSDAHLSSGTLTLNGGTLNLNNAGNIDNAVVLGASNGTISVTNGGGTLSGNITGTGSLTKTGGQLLTLSGTNGYSGGTTVRGLAGLSVTNGSNLGTGAVALEANLTITGTGTVSNAIAINADATITNDNAVTLSGVLSGSSVLTKAGAGTLTLSGTNTHTGAVTVSAGGLTLQGSPNSGIGDSSAVTVGSGATLTLNGGNETIGSLAGAGNVVLSYRLTAGGDNTDTTFSGVISGIGNGIVKQGTGTLTLTGNNTYTGSTRVSAGTLIVNRAGGALADATAVTVDSGATFTVSQTETIGSISSTGAVVLNAGTLTVGGGGTSTTVSGVISGSGNLAKVGNGTLILSGTNTYSGTTTVSAGTLAATNSASLGTAGGGTTVASGGALSIQGGITLAENLTLSGTGSFGSGALINASGTNTLSGTVALAANTSIVTSAETLTLSGIVSGGFGLTKDGTGTLVLSAANTYSGATTVSAGTLAGTGTVGGALTIASGATLSPGVAGPGTLTVNGNLVIASGGILSANINGTTAGSGYDQVVVNGTVDVTGATLSTTLGFTPALNDSFRLIDNDSFDSINGTFSGLAEGAMSGALQASYVGGDGNDITLTLINNAPTGVGNLTLAAINEDAASPAGAAISALTGYSFQDTDSGATSPGVLVVGNTANAATEGVWQYSSDGGANWKAIGTVADGATALALASSTQVRFVPVADYNDIPPAMSIRALDNTYAAAFSTTTGGTETRVTANSSVNGAATAISGTLNTIGTSITAVNDAPGFIKGADQVVNEDAGAQTVSGWATGLSKGPADESSQTLSFTVSNNNNGLFSVQPTIDSSGNLTYTPATNVNGTATVTVSIRDSGGTANGGVDTSATQIFTITVTPINDAPAFIKGADQAVNEDAGAQAVAGWATGLSSGPANESGQTLSFVTSNTNNALFSVQPTIDSNGNLSYTPAANANGTATITVVLSDSDGGNSASQTFTITVNPVNDVPGFTKGADQVVNEDTGAQTVNGWATGLSKGPVDESSQTLSFTVSNNNNGLFSVQPTIDSNGNLTYTPAANANGTATVTVSIKDSGGTANGGIDTSATQTFTITINPVNDEPTGAVTISGTPNVGTTLTVANTLSDADGLGPVSYQWQAGGVDISGATGSSYKLTEAEVGKTITVIARYTDGNGSATSVASAATSVVTALTINLSQQTGNTDNSISTGSGSGGIGSIFGSSSGGAMGGLGGGLGGSSSGLSGGGLGSGLGGGLGGSSGGFGGSGSGLGGSGGGFGSSGTGGSSGFGSGTGGSQTMVMDMRLSTDSSGTGTTGGTISLPSSVFAGLNTFGAITINATQASGQSLPSFITVNPSTGAVTVKEGAVVSNPITVKLIIRDSQGRQVVVLVKVQPQNGRSHGQGHGHGHNQGQGQQSDSEENNQPGSGDNQRAQLEQADNRLAQAGKSGLTQQLQMAGRKGFELQRQKLLDSLASITKNGKDAA